MSDAACTTSAASAPLDANTEAMLRADIEQVLAKYRLQATDVKVEIGSSAHPSATPPAPASPAKLDDCPSPLNATAPPPPPTAESPAAADTTPKKTTTEPATASTAPAPSAASAEPILFNPSNIADALNPANFIPPELQLEMERQRQRQERDRILKSFTGKSVLLADKKKRDEEKRQHARFSPGARPSSHQAAATTAAPAPTQVAHTAAVQPAPAPAPAQEPRVDGGNTSSCSSGGSRPGSRHTAVCLPEAPPTDSRPGSERRCRSGATVPVFSILAKEGTAAGLGTSASSDRLNGGVSVKDSPAVAEVVHVPLTGTEAAAVQPSSILRSSLCSGSLTPLPPLANTAKSEKETSAAAAPVPTAASSRAALVQEQIAVSRDNQRRVSDMMMRHPTPRQSLDAQSASSAKLPPAPVPRQQRLSTGLNSPLGGSASRPSDSPQQPPPSQPQSSLRELLASQEKEERLAERRLSEHQRLLSSLRPCTVASSAETSPVPPAATDACAGVSGLTPSPPQPVVSPTRLPAPPRSPRSNGCGVGGGTSAAQQQPQQRPSSSASGRALSARGGIQVCRVTLPTEPKARAEVVEQFCGSTAGQEALGSKNRYEYMLASQQQLLSSRKKEEQEYQAILAKAVALNQKLQGP